MYSSDNNGFCLFTKYKCPHLRLMRARAAVNCEKRDRCIVMKNGPGQRGYESSNTALYWVYTLISLLLLIILL